LVIFFRGTIDTHLETSVKNSFVWQRCKAHALFPVAAAAADASQGRDEPSQGKDQDRRGSLRGNQSIDPVVALFMPISFYNAR
jgi:hypothetical protein